jgi:HEAT repeat protein
VRKRAAEALERLGWAPNRGTAGAAFWATKGEWEKCAKIGPAAVKPLLMVLKEEREPVRREAAARTLGEIGDHRAVAALSVAAQDKYIRVGKAAADALVKIVG